MSIGSPWGEIFASSGAGSAIFSFYGATGYYSTSSVGVLVSSNGVLVSSNGVFYSSMGSGVYSLIAGGVSSFKGVSSINAASLTVTCSS